MSPEEFAALLRRSPAAVLGDRRVCERARRTKAQYTAWDGRAGTCWMLCVPWTSMATDDSGSWRSAARRAITPTPVGRGKS